MPDELQPNMIAIRLPALFQRKAVNGDITGTQVMVELKVTFPDGSVVKRKEDFRGKSMGAYERHIEIKHPSLREGTGRA
jgi:predicted metal-dependent hydrolase